MISDYFDWQDAFNCIREPSFPIIYSNLGNEEKIEEIWTNASDPRRCKFLMLSPIACECLPEGLGGPEDGIPVGEPCPNNPAHKNRPLHEKISANMNFVDWVMELCDRLEFNRGAELTSEEFDIARTVIKLVRKRRNIDLARAIRAEIADMLSDNKAPVS